MSETAIMREIHTAVVQTGRALLWRNNTGLATYGSAKVAYGLGLGGADLVGVVKGTGRFLALEVKTPEGRLSAEQKAWRRAVEASGAYYACVRSVDEALEALERAAA